MKVQICTGKSCKGRFSNYIITRLENDTNFYNWKGISIEECCCMGDCKKGPNVVVGKEKHHGVNPARASEIILNRLSEKKKQEEQKKEKKSKKK